MGTVFRIYDGFSFKLTPEQIESISAAQAEVEEAAARGEPCALLAQVWTTEDGVYCCANAVPVERVKMVRDVLNEPNIVGLRVGAAEVQS